MISGEVHEIMLHAREQQGELRLGARKWGPFDKLPVPSWGNMVPWSQNGLLGLSKGSGHSEVVFVFLLSGTGDSLRANHSQLAPPIFIARPADSLEFSGDSRESCESTRANHATKFS